MSVPADSRYAKVTEVHDVDTGEVYLWTRQPIDLPPAPTDTYVRPRDGERLDQLAYRVWGATFGERATRLWWVIADLNLSARNPLLPLDPTQLLRVPSAERLALEVLS